jgi:hypothetical protein
MGSTKELTVSKIKTHIMKRGGIFKSWFVGTGQHAGKELRRHGVKRKGNCWILVRASSASIAENVRSHLVEALGLLTQEGQRGDFVYAYKLATNTKP